MRLRTTIALTSATLALIAAGAWGLGVPVPPAVLLAWAAGAVAAQMFPWRRDAIAVMAGAIALAVASPIFSLYVFALIGGLAAVRTRALPFAAVLVLGGVVWPKLAFAHLYHQPAWWSWLREPNLAVALFAGASWWRARADARRTGAAPPSDLQSFLLLNVFPAQVTYPMAFTPRLLAQARCPSSIDVHALATLAACFAVKVAVLVGIGQLGPQALLRGLTPSDVPLLGRWSLRGIVVVSYVETYLMLATSADIPVLVGRLFGFALPAPFRAPLLAWTPAELWRRWGVYNRRFLLELVYFPLGGNKRHPCRNVLLTFLASALVLHTGWFGSKYWAIGTGGWRDETLYFGLQAIAVCGYLLWRAREGAPVRARGDQPVRWSWRHTLGLIATQSWSALAHVVVLAQGLDLADRARLIRRCLGFG